MGFVYSEIVTIILCARVAAGDVYFKHFRNEAIFGEHGQAVFHHIRLKSLKPPNLFPIHNTVSKINDEILPRILTRKKFTALGNPEI